MSVQDSVQAWTQQKWRWKDGRSQWRRFKARIKKAREPMTTEAEPTEPVGAAKMFGWLALFIAAACLTAALVRSCAPVPPKLPAHATAEPGKADGTTS